MYRSESFFLSQIFSFSSHKIGSREAPKIENNSVSTKKSFYFVYNQDLDPFKLEGIKKREIRFKTA